jgi:Xaa-Pro dipeptidase
VRFLPRDSIATAILSLACLSAGCAAGPPSSGTAPASFEKRPDGTVVFFDGRTVPPNPRLLGIREQYELRAKWIGEKHAALLDMMRKHGISMWIIVNEEFHDDPVTAYVAPPLNYVGRRDIHAFVDAGDQGLRKFSNLRRPDIQHQRLFEPMPIARDSRGFQDAAAGLRNLYEQYRPRTIGLNMGGRRGQDSGLTFDSYKYLCETLGPEAEKRFVSAASLIEDYFDTRLPDELEYYRAAVQVTSNLAQRALSNEVITPGVTRVMDVYFWFYERIAELGVGAEPWFDIHTNVQHLDPETGKAIPWIDPAPDEYVYQPGDVIHLDCGFDYLGFATDWQKVAYILKPGETDVPAGFKVAMQNAIRTQEAIMSAARPGMTGHQAAAAALEKLQGVDFVPSLYSHPIGYHGHGVGPSINARDGVLGEPPARDSVLRLGGYRSIEFSATTAIPEWNGEKLRVPYEDDAYLTEEGYKLFVPAQSRWYLIR